MVLGGEREHSLNKSQKGNRRKGQITEIYMLLHWVHVESCKGSGPNLTIRKRAPQLSSGQRSGQGDHLGVAKGYRGLRQDGAKAKEALGLFLFLYFWQCLGWNPGPCLRGKC